MVYDNQHKRNILERVANKIGANFLVKYGCTVNLIIEETKKEFGITEKE